MSLLRTNAILKRYRREHLEQDAAELSAKAEGQFEEGCDDHTAAYPNVDAFQAIGLAPGAMLAPLLSPPSLMRNEQTTQMTGMAAQSRGSLSAGEPSGFHGTVASLESLQNTPVATMAAAPSTTFTIQTSFLREGGDEGNHTTPGRSSRSRDPMVRAGAEEETFPGVDHFAAPRCPLLLLSPPTSGASPALATTGRRDADSTAPLGWRSPSDLSGAEDRGLAGAHSHLIFTHPTALSTIGTTGWEAVASVADMPVAAQPNHDARETAASALAPLAGESCEPVCSASGLSSSLLAARTLRRLTGGGERAHISAPVSTVLPRSIEGLTRAYQSPSVEKGSSTLSSPSSPSTAAEQQSNRGEVEGEPPVLREEAVRQLDLVYARMTVELPTASVHKDSSTSAALRFDMSDTLLQPPTSILSEPSTATARTRDKSAMSFGSFGRPVAYGSLASRRLAYTTDGGDATDEGVFSPISLMDDTERGFYARAVGDRNALLADNRAAVPMPQLLSFSGTARSSPRIWDDEDVDVDPTTAFSDPSLRLSFALPPITFYEAYLSLTKKLQPADTSAAFIAEGETVKTAESSSKLSPQAIEVPKLKKRSLISIFWCCSDQGRAAATVGKQPQSSPPSPRGLTREERNGVAAAEATVSTPGGPEEHLRIIRALKSQSLSLQLPTHRRMLLTVFNTLTGNIPWVNTNGNPLPSSSDAPLPLFSPTTVKWESIGFQGANPATDVRATGVLGVIQLLYLIDYYPAFAQRLWQLCRDPANERASPPLSNGHCGSAPPATAKGGGVSDELPFVLVCFSFTAVVLDAAGQHILDDEVQKVANARLPVSASQATLAKTTRPVPHPSSYPGMYVCCECYVGALALFVDAWRARPQGEARGNFDVAASTVPLKRPSIADFGDIKARLRGQLLKKGAAKVMQEAARHVRGAEGRY
ncbi:putative ELMO/CED-12 family [Leishmania shawi]